jgi:hypothetical protein
LPSRIAESSRGIEPGQVGWSHHRWLIDIAGDEVRFMMKYHKIHSDWPLSLSSGFFRRLPEERKVQWLFWRDSFRCAEVTLHSTDRIHSELMHFVDAVSPYRGWRLALDQMARTCTSLARRALRKAPSWR